MLDGEGYKCPPWTIAAPVAPGVLALSVGDIDWVFWDDMGDLPRLGICIVRS